MQLTMSGPAATSLAPARERLAFDTSSDRETSNPARHDPGISPRGLEMLAVLNELFDQESPE